MTPKTLPITAAILVLGFALMTAGCQQQTEQAERSAAPQRTSESTEAERGQSDALIAPYLDLRRLLAEDKLDGVSEELAAIGQAAQPLTDSNDAQVKVLAEKIVDHAAAQPEGLDSARKSFEAISAAMIDLVKRVPPSDAVAETLYVAYCPMAKASWLQATEELANPYMGPKMLKCGEVTETIATGKS